MEKQRFDWVDVAKTLGLFAIYLGHFATDAGYSYLFVFAYHVPMFFFLSGCIESLNQETRIIQNVKKKAINILIPYAFFATISILQYAIQYNVSYDIVLSQFILVLKGSTRNVFFVYQLWFLTCLFVMYVLFEFIKKLKYKSLMTGISLLLFIVSEKFLPTRPIVTPSWYYNIDSALYYIVFFCLGYVSFPTINRILSSKSTSSQMLLYTSAIITFVYSICLFFQYDFLSTLSSIPYLVVVIPIIRALIVIWVQIIIANLCKNIILFREMGKNSLYLCGNEYIIKSVIPCIASIVGLEISTRNPFSTMVYTAMLLYIVYKFMIPVESKCIKAIETLFKNTRNKRSLHQGVSI